MYLAHYEPESVIIVIVEFLANLQLIKSMLADLQLYEPL